MHAHHAEREGMPGGDGAEAQQRGGDRDLARLGEAQHLSLCAGFDAAVTGEDHGTLRSSD